MTRWNISDMLSPGKREVDHAHAAYHRQAKSQTTKSKLCSFLGLSNVNESSNWDTERKVPVVPN